MTGNNLFVTIFIIDRITIFGNNFPLVLCSSYRHETKFKFIASNFKVKRKRITKNLIEKHVGKMDEKFCARLTAVKVRFECAPTSIDNTKDFSLCCFWFGCFFETMQTMQLSNKLLLRETRDDGEENFCQAIEQSLPTRKNENNRKQLFAKCTRRNIRKYHLPVSAKFSLRFCCSDKTGSLVSWEIACAIKILSHNLNDYIALISISLGTLLSFNSEELRIFH